MMEETFIAILGRFLAELRPGLCSTLTLSVDLSHDANILFASDSITEILGYQCREVLNKPCFAYFHPDEIDVARSIHKRGLGLDQAAVLHYVRIRSSHGH